jgi:class 3 adenylate cyclase
VGHGYTVLGDAVNLAARLVELAKPGETVISEPLAHLLKGKIRAAALPPATLKGIASPVTGRLGPGGRRGDKASRLLHRALSARQALDLL